MTSQQKVFGIGAPKTGTSSLGKAFQRLGFNHKSYDSNLNEEYNRGNHEVILLEAEKFNSFEDGPWNRGSLYKALDEKYANSKFILTIREVDSWIISHEKHFVAKRLRKHPWELWKRAYTAADKERIKNEYIVRNQAVVDYFKDRPEVFMIMNICAGEGYEKLCPFLGLPILDEPFPKSNLTNTKDLSTIGIWKMISEKSIRNSRKKVKSLF